ncbi:hypothetical protein EON62_02795, partial [archaeon]
MLKRQDAQAAASVTRILRDIAAALSSPGDVATEPQHTAVARGALSRHASRLAHGAVHGYYWTPSHASKGEHAPLLLPLTPHVQGMLLALTPALDEWVATMRASLLYDNRAVLAWIESVLSVHEALRTLNRLVYHGPMSVLEVAHFMRWCFRNQASVQSQERLKRILVLALGKGHTHDLLRMAYDFDEPRHAPSALDSSRAVGAHARRLSVRSQTGTPASGLVLSASDISLHRAAGLAATAGTPPPPSTTAQAPFCSRTVQRSRTYSETAIMMHSDAADEAPPSTTSVAAQAATPSAQPHAEDGAARAVQPPVSASSSRPLRRVSRSFQLPPSMVGRSLLGVTETGSRRPPSTRTSQLTTHISSMHGEDHTSGESSSSDDRVFSLSSSTNSDFPQSILLNQRLGTSSEERSRATTKDSEYKRRTFTNTSTTSEQSAGPEWFGQDARTVSVEVRVVEPVVETEQVTAGGDKSQSTSTPSNASVGMPLLGFEPVGGTASSAPAGVAPHRWSSGIARTRARPAPVLILDPTSAASQATSHAIAPSTMAVGVVTMRSRPPLHTPAICSDGGPQPALGATPSTIMLSSLLSGRSTRTHAHVHLPSVGGCASGTSAGLFLT